MAETRKAYRNTRTDAVRLSSKELGYPYVLAEKPSKDADAGKADKASNGDDGKSAKG